MDFDDYDSVCAKLEEVLASKYPDDSIEMGENWILLAQIFFDLGVESMKNSLTDSM